MSVNADTFVVMEDVGIFVVLIRPETFVVLVYEGLFHADVESKVVR